MALGTTVRGARDAPQAEGWAIAELCAYKSRNSQELTLRCEENEILWDRDSTLELRASGAWGKLSFPWLWTRRLGNSWGQPGNGRHRQGITKDLLLPNNLLLHVRCWRLRGSRRV